MIHPTAVVDTQAEIAADATIGPYAVVEGPVRIHSGVTVHTHAHVCGWTTLGPRVEVHPFATIGGAPQDLGYAGAVSYVVVGAETVIREYASVHRGTAPESTTTIGSGCLLMAKSHVAHNCVVGDGVILTNGADLGGHVEVGDRALLAGGAAVHQFCRIGRRAMVVGHARVMHDVPPFLVADYDGAIAKVNVIGLRREGLDADAVRAVRTAFRQLYRGQRPMSLELDALKSGSHCEEVAELLAFIAHPSRRGIAGPRRRPSHASGQPMMPNVT